MEVEFDGLGVFAGRVVEALSPSSWEVHFPQDDSTATIVAGEHRYRVTKRRATGDHGGAAAKRPRRANVKTEPEPEPSTSSQATAGGGAAARVSAGVGAAAEPVFDLRQEPTDEQVAALPLVFRSRRRDVGQG